MGANRSNDNVILYSRRYQPFTRLNPEHRAIYNELFNNYIVSKKGVIKGNREDHLLHLDNLKKLSDFQKMIRDFYNIVHR